MLTRYNRLFVVIPSAFDAYQVVISTQALRNGKPIRLDPLRPDEIKLSNNITFNKVSAYNHYINSFPSLDGLGTAITDSYISHMDTPQWQKLSQSDCAKRYKSRTYSHWSHVAIFANWIDESTATATNNSANFLGALMGANYGYQALIDYCPPTFLSSPQGVNFTWPESYSFSNELSELCGSYKKKEHRDSNKQLVEYTYPNPGNIVEYCLSKVEEEKCVLAIPKLFLRVLSCLLAVQLLGMIATLIMEWKRTPLLIIGDALASFLKQPDSVHFTDSEIKEPPESLNSSIKWIYWLSAPIFVWLLVAITIGTVENVKIGLRRPQQQ